MGLGLKGVLRVSLLIVILAGLAGCRYTHAHAPVDVAKTITAKSDARAAQRSRSYRKQAARRTMPKPRRKAVAGKKAERIASLAPPRQLQSPQLSAPQLSPPPRLPKAQPAPPRTRLVAKRQSIVGGNEVSSRTHPWQVLLKIHGGTCGASLIRPNIVLSAAHCFFEHDRFTGRATRLARFDRNRPLRLYFGSNIAEAGRLVEVTSASLTIHPQYCPKGQEATTRCASVGSRGSDANDLALIRLPFSVVNADPKSLVRPIALADPVAEADWIAEDDTPVITTGWGLYDLGTGAGGSPKLSRDTARKLREVTVQVKMKLRCKNAWAKVGGALVTDGMLCAGTDSGGKDSCGGDSGGPLIVSRQAAGKPYLQVGLVSWGPRACGTKGLYGVYTRISRYKAWIDRQIGTGR